MTFERKILQFHEMELDDRILKAIAKVGWTEPTLIQEKAIPLLLEGKDVLMRARTGSGKTGAFAVPIIQKILLSKQESEESSIRALILAPSRELCRQIYKNILELTCKCSRDVRCLDISPEIDASAQKSLLMNCPDVLVSTPSKLLGHIKNMSIKESLETLVIDEADLIFSFGYQEDMKEVLKHLPKICQTTLASATLSEDVISLKKLVLHKPVILKLEEPDVAPLTQLTHYYLNAEEEQKAVILYTLFKLNLMPGKIIVFVNTVDRCYKLKLFLEQFGISSCVLNSELPSTSRCHAVMQFNENKYNIIIASDESSLDGQKLNPDLGKKRKRDKESGVARGIDFQQVSNVINFDVPLDIYSYVHRAGRTARASNKGTVLSFVNIREQPMMQEIDSYLMERLSEETGVLAKYKFDLEQVEGFQYRAKDAWRAVTRIAVRESRLKEIKQEILNSRKLKRYFDENPRDLQSLRHDKALHTVKLQDHLTDVPDYIVPPSLRDHIPNKNEKLNSQKIKYKTGRSKAYNKYLAKKKNPLISMEFNETEKVKNSK